MNNFSIKDLGCTVKKRTKNTNALFVIGTDYLDSLKIVDNFNPKKPTTLYGMYLSSFEDVGTRNAVIEFPDGISKKDATAMLKEIMYGKRYVTLGRSKFKSTAKGVKGKVLPFIPALLKSEIDVTVDIGETKEAHIKQGFTLSNTANTKKYKTKKFCLDPDPSKNGWLVYNPIMMPNVDPSKVIEFVEGETKFLEVTTCEELEKIGEDDFMEKFFEGKRASMWHNQSPPYIIFHVEENMLNVRSVPYNKGFYDDRGQLQIGNIIKISGPAYDFFSDFHAKNSDVVPEIMDSPESVKESVDNLISKYKYHYQSYLKDPLIYDVDIQLNDTTAEFECAVALVKEEMTLDQFWELKNKVVSFPAKQFQKDNKFRKFELKINPTATCLYLYSANAEELGMPYHKILSEKLLQPDGSPSYLHGNVLRFEGKAKECAKRYFNSIPTHIGDIKL